MIRSALAKPETMECGLSEKALTYASLFRFFNTLMMKASVEVSESVCALGIITPATMDVGIRFVNRSTMRILGVMKKAPPEV